MVYSVIIVYITGREDSVLALYHLLLMIKTEKKGGELLFFIPYKHAVGKKRESLRRRSVPYRRSVSNGNYDYNIDDNGSALSSIIGDDEKGSAVRKTYPPKRSAVHKTLSDSPSTERVTRP